LQEAEDALRQELHRRTSTILGLQAKVDGQDAALSAAARQQAALQGQLQVRCMLTVEQGILLVPWWCKVMHGTCNSY
jgi:hypothetical protein